jgi:hypothetical protein
MAYQLALAAVTLADVTAWVAIVRAVGWLLS